MAEFVRAQIFGTTFEITSRYAVGGVRHIFRDNGTADFDLHRYSDLQPVGMGAFGLVWCDLPLYDFSPMTFTDIIPQLCKRSAYRPKCRG
jgi:hypothetical protein